MSKATITYTGDLKILTRRLRYFGYHTRPSHQPGDYCKVYGDGFTLRLRTDQIIASGDLAAARLTLQEAGVTV